MCNPWTIPTQTYGAPHSPTCGPKTDLHPSLHTANSIHLNFNWPDIQPTKTVEPDFEVYEQLEDDLEVYLFKACSVYVVSNPQF